MRLREDQGPSAVGTDWELKWGTLDPDIRAAADLLRRNVVRYQPSFRFQEALAARLRGAERADFADTALAPITMLPVVERLLPGVASADGANGLAAGVAGWNRSLLVGGAIASGVSLAGAIVAWRLGRLRVTGLAAGATAVARRIEERV